MKKGKNVNTTPSKNKTALNDMHRAVIDEYFANGFNATRAAMTVRPELNYNAAADLGSFIINSDKNKTYIEQKQYQIQRAAKVKPYELVNELKNIAFNDITDYLNLSPEELKQLSPDKRRGIKKVTVKEKTYRSKGGDTSTEKTYIIEAHDKLKALQEVGKIIGIYSLDNSQKATKINLTKLDVTTLNAILNATDTGPE